MFFRKRGKDTEIIVEYLASLGVNKNGESLFLDSEDISKELVLEFLEKCKITEETFRFDENILRFSNTYNALKVLLNLKDKTLEGHVLKKLRAPLLFLRLYKLDTHAFQDQMHGQVEKGFGLFIDNLEISERLIVIGANEILASRFMNYLSRGQIGKEDDQSIWLTFSLGIYNHMQLLPRAIAKAKQKLKLK